VTWLMILDSVEVLGKAEAEYGSSTGKKEELRTYDSSVACKGSVGSIHAYATSIDICQEEIESITTRPDSTR
jgi:hypothetical protein